MDVVFDTAMRPASRMKIRYSRHRIYTRNCAEWCGDNCHWLSCNHRVKHSLNHCLILFQRDEVNTPCGLLVCALNVIKLWYVQADLMSLPAYLFKSNADANKKCIWLRKALPYQVHQLKRWIVTKYTLLQYFSDGDKYEHGQWQCYRFSL